jgi:hypothetical protein
MRQLFLALLLPLAACSLGPGSQLQGAARNPGESACLGVAAAGLGGGVGVMPQGMIGTVEETATTCKISATGWQYPPTGTQLPTGALPAKPAS